MPYCYLMILFSPILGEDVDQSCVEVRQEDFMKALDGLVPSVSEQELERYKLLHHELKHNAR